MVIISPPFRRTFEKKDTLTEQKLKAPLAIWNKNQSIFLMYFSFSTIF